MATHIEKTAEVTIELNGARLDQAAAKLFAEFSRERLKQWIKAGELTLAGQKARPRDAVMEGQLLALKTELESQERWQPQDIALDIVHEDDSLLVINKPAGLVVHPAAGHADGTLLNALLNHAPALNELPRAGIVHRLDRDTCGVMVVAKTLQAHHSLVGQLQARSVHREYEAVVHGALTGGGTVNADMGRHPRQRQKMAVVPIGGKTAITHYRLMERFGHHSHIRCMLETGRTHQIRVHMAHVRHPLIGDPVYGGRPKLPKGASTELIEALQSFKRQALQARKLELIHPETEELVSWEVARASDIEILLATLRNG